MTPTTVRQRASIRPRANAQSFGDQRDDATTALRAGSKLLCDRLSPSDCTTLRWVFGELEGTMGIGSNFGAMCQRLRELDVRADLPLELLEPAGEADLPLASVPRESRGGQRIPYRIGPKLPLSEMVPRSTMHVKSAIASNRELVPRIEKWACWTNGGRPAFGGALGSRYQRSRNDIAIGSRVHDARAALLTMPLDAAVALYRMYGQDTSRSMLQRYPDLGDLVALAEDSDIVAAHATKLTKELRQATGAEAFRRGIAAEDAEEMRRARCAAEIQRLTTSRDAALTEEASDRYQVEIDDMERRLSVPMPRVPTIDETVLHVGESRLTVTPREALSNLLESLPLDSKRRNTIAKEIYDECAHTLVRASNAFRKARAEL